MAETKLKNLDSLISCIEGLPQRTVEHVLLQVHINYRVTRIDHSFKIITMNLDMGRLNLEVDNGIVTKVSRG